MKKYSLLFVAALALSANAQRTPTMGWSSWNTFALNINEQLIRQQADAMHNTGLQKAGYKYVNIDDGYWDGRDADGDLRLNKKLFPTGIAIDTSLQAEAVDIIDQRTHTAGEQLRVQTQVTVLATTVPVAIVDVDELITGLLQTCVVHGVSL